MITGILCIGLAVSLLGYNGHENKKAEQKSAVIMKSVLQNIETEKTTQEVVDVYDEEMKVKEIDGNGYIGYLSIPSLEIDLPVMSDWDYEKLESAPCRYYGSTKTNNLVIAAHNYEVHFGYLGHLSEGDFLSFTDMQGKAYHYVVTSVELLLPADTEKVKDTGDDLILYTCNYSGSKRITVRCSYTK